MLKISLVLVFAALALALADPRVQQHRGLTADAHGFAGHPYLFLRVPHGRAGSVVKGFEVVEEDKPNVAAADDDDESNDEAEHDDEDDETVVGIVQQGASRAAISDEDLEDEEADDDDDDDDNEMDSKDVMNMVQVVDSKKTSSMANNLQTILQNLKPTQMMVSKEHAGAIMVPDGIIEIEGQRIIDEKTGKAAILVPREALEAIPDGSVVALMERDDTDEEERANRVIVRRRRLGSRRNVRRRGGNSVYRRRVNNKKKNNRNRNTINSNNKRRRRIQMNNVRVVRNGYGYGNNNRKRRGKGNRQRNGNRPVMIQG